MITRRFGERAAARLGRAASGPVYSPIGASQLRARASEFAEVFMTGLRLLCRFGSGHPASLSCNGVDGRGVDLTAEHIVLDYDDVQPESRS